MYFVLNQNNYDYARDVIISFIVMIVLGLVFPLLGYFKLINKIENSRILGWELLMPIFLRFILIAGFTFLSIQSGMKELAVSLILFTFVMLTNFIHLATRKQCNSSNNRNAGWRFLKVFMDTLFQFAIIFLFVGVFNKTRQYANELYDIELTELFKLGDIIESFIWIFGLVFGFILTNMIDSNFDTSDKPPKYEDDSVCKGDISALRITTSSLLFVITLGYYIYQYRLNNY
jgi:hypothetical protein